MPARWEFLVSFVERIDGRVVSDPECLGTRRFEADMRLLGIATINCNATIFQAFTSNPDVIDLQSPPSSVAINMSGEVNSSDLTQFGQPIVDIYNQDGDVVQQVDATMAGNETMQISPNTQNWSTGHIPC